MSAIADRFQQLRERGEKALIPYVTAGDPNLETTFEALRVLDQNGADLIELGVPYSDPLADGPVIQAAATRALARGVRLQAILEGLTDLHLQAPVILFSYYNPIYQIGFSRFMEWIKSAGASGIVVPDLSFEESCPIRAAAQHAQLDVILLVAPTSSKTRMARIAAASSGFIYLVSTTGVTGQRENVAESVKQLLRDLRSQTSLPIGVGFGISTPDQARQVAQWGADAIIVGSAFVNRLAQAETTAAGLSSIAQFCQELKSALLS